ncbi:NDE2, mitochondrial external NADH dehydrogenase [Serpula lacrymans var. lacrymans S7.3]|uniref:NADH:ubiquinone reductase (non-electrogenic) n=2 Tax=Serpula lacrymans var. lacrymans TaxID=341189 RepID=F8QB29_SERL3|nr:mitochondrial external NADH dehydrogenase, NDE1 [Serpula lacrymans var. lacrymans S7.9]EGN94415.1 NDE2, mitochondrial external NADH dehydrogenase [Serpula lacrymans var. lacrymans S7.3]EGO19896.1 mitochondrial external NADH dehydrogenase, NDE1 [Serpula lacrymans var. lacrymans S7.9]
MQVVRSQACSRFMSRSTVHSRLLPSHVQKQLSLRVISRALATTSEPATSGAPSPPPSPPKHPKWKGFLQTLGRVTLVTIIAATGTFYYVTQKDRHPGTQLPFDPEKKTLVILGSGWAATSLLKGLDTTHYNTIVVSPKNFFLFTPLLPSVAVGTLNARSILQPTRYITRFKNRQVSVIEAEAKVVDPINKTVTFSDDSEIQGKVSSTTIPYDYLVYAVGAETQTFGIPGVKKHACFMKELHDAERMQRQFMDCVESAAFPGQSDQEIDRLLHMVVVGGGPTGVELSGELHDFLEDDLKSWYPELASRIRITLVEALPSVLPMFSKKLIDYTESTFKESKIDILTKTMVKEVKDKSVVLQMPDKSIAEVPCGMVVWAAGNTGRQVTRDLMAKLPEEQTNKRGITVDDHLMMKGSNGSIFAVGDCTASSYAPTAQVASQQGAYLARIFALVAKKDNLEAQLVKLEGTTEPEKQAEADRIRKQIDKIKLKPFHYSHQGSLAYIGSEKAVADLPIFGHEWASGGVATYLFWRSAYLSTLFSLRNRTLVASDWLRVKLFGRDVSRD